jgi:hypothetical protein
MEILKLMVFFKERVILERSVRTLKNISLSEIRNDKIGNMVNSEDSIINVKSRRIDLRSELKEIVNA